MSLMQFNQTKKI